MARKKSKSAKASSTPEQLGAKCTQYVAECLKECGLYDAGDDTWLEKNEGWVRSVGCHPGYESPMESLFGSARTRFLDMKSIAGSEGHLGELGRLCRELAIPVELINERMQIRAGRVFGLLRGIQEDADASLRELRAKGIQPKLNKKALTKPLPARPDEPPLEAGKRFGILVENRVALCRVWSTESEKEGRPHLRRLSLLRQCIEEEVRHCEHSRLPIERMLEPDKAPGDLCPPRLFWWSAEDT